MLVDDSNRARAFRAVQLNDRLTARNAAEMFAGFERSKS